MHPACNVPPGHEPAALLAWWRRDDDLRLVLRLGKPDRHSLRRSELDRLGLLVEVRIDDPLRHGADDRRLGHRLGRAVCQELDDRRLMLRQGYCSACDQQSLGTRSRRSPPTTAHVPAGRNNLVEDRVIE